MQPQAVVVLADFVEPHRASALVLDTIGFLPGDVDDETDLGELRSVRVYAGYAGWAPDSSRTSSTSSPGSCSRHTPSDVFTNVPDALWSEVLRRHGGALGILALLPEDPHVN